MRGAHPEIRAHDRYYPPYILHYESYESSVKLDGAQSRMSVCHDVPCTALNTATLCADYQEVVAVRCEMTQRKIMLGILVYIRPDKSVRRRLDFA